MTKTYYQKKEFNRLTEKIEFRIEKADREKLKEHCMENNTDLSSYLRDLMKKDLYK